MKVEGVAFDLEGNVIDVEFAHHRGHLYSAARVGVHLTLEQAINILPHFIGGPDTAIAREIFELSGEKSSPEAISQDKTTHYNEQLSTLDKIEPRVGFLEFLIYARGLGLPTAIGSLTVRHQALTLLRASGLDQLFPSTDILLREDVVNVKPDPEVYLKTAQIMGIDPANQLVFDDSPNGIRASIAAGSRAIGMPVYYDMPEVREALKVAGASRIFRNWRQVNIKTHRIF